jgi:hypothetical protein
MDWNNTNPPEEGAIVQVLAMDSLGQYAIPFPVVFREDAWRNAYTGEELRAFVAGWRPLGEYCVQVRMDAPRGRAS